MLWFEALKCYCHYFVTDVNKSCMCNRSVSMTDGCMSQYNGSFDASCDFSIDDGQLGK